MTILKNGVENEIVDLMHPIEETLCVCRWCALHRGESNIRVGTHARTHKAFLQVAVRDALNPHQTLPSRRRRVVAPSHLTPSRRRHAGRRRCQGTRDARWAVPHLSSPIEGGTGRLLDGKPRHEVRSVLDVARYRPTCRRTVARDPD
ncbi:hypothetical protein EVAR_21495_1 [Eumeta japonica]|uniref:Uncharacterized protein n=1 Tax=Eumeta variegata TaxID=151549 RepID=A0A4C1UXM9_EUMVA|nr:hypothetical protein EVAR_21495_1 [Eumeta japonica]